MSSQADTPPLTGVPKAASEDMSIPDGDTGKGPSREDHNGWCLQLVVDKWVDG